MKLILISMIFFLLGCAQLNKGQQQPIIEKSFKERIYFTTCSGAVEDWGSCNQKAQSTCLNGYSVLEKFENAVGGRRELTFQCKD
jgi:hypothetical protein